jgi:hypothetical protein
LIRKEKVIRRYVGNLSGKIGGRLNNNIDKRLSGGTFQRDKFKLIVGNLDVSGFATFFVNLGGEIDSDITEVFGLNVKRDASLNNAFNAGKKDKRCPISINDNSRKRHDAEFLF